MRVSFKPVNIDGRNSTGISGHTLLVAGPSSCLGTTGFPDNCWV